MCPSPAPSQCSTETWVMYVIRLLHICLPSICYLCKPLVSSQHLLSSYNLPIVRSVHAVCKVCCDSSGSFSAKAEATASYMTSWAEPKLVEPAIFSQLSGPANTNWGQLRWAKLVYFCTFSPRFVHLSFAWPHDYDYDTPFPFKCTSDTRHSYTSAQHHY